MIKDGASQGDIFETDTSDSDECQDRNNIWRFPVIPFSPRTKENSDLINKAFCPSRQVGLGPF